MIRMQKLDKGYGSGAEDVSGSSRVAELRSDGAEI